MLPQNLYHHDGSKYHLHAYCLMPNHVHVLLTPNPDEASATSTVEQTTVGEADDAGSPLSKIMHSLKSYTANQANKTLGRSGTFWQPESYDHWVRDDNELERIVNYIRANPVKAGLVSRHQDWCWCSCHDRFQYDGDTTAWLPS
ncbi:MAG: transposase [Rubripirellula sp.]